MKKLNLKNLSNQKLDDSKMKNIAGGSGYRCPAYYCTYVNPNASCCW
ncbi:TIGR04149 family rSAM-modified RiPP [Flagellimonas sp. S174]